MRLPSRGSLLFVAFMTLGLFLARHACLAQGADIALVGGQCYSCGWTPCSWHDVSCESAAGHTCTQCASCCRGPDTGGETGTHCHALRDSQGNVLYQCTAHGCVPRPDEICVED